MKRLVLMPALRHASLWTRLRGSMTNGSVAAFFTNARTAGDKMIEPVGIGRQRDVDLNVEPSSAEALGQGVCCRLTDVIGVVVGEDVQSGDAGRRLEGLDPVCGQRGPRWQFEHLMRGEGCLDAFGYTEFIARVVETHRRAVDRIDCRQGLLSWLDLGVVDALG